MCDAGRTFVDVPIVLPRREQPSVPLSGELHIQIDLLLRVLIISPASTWKYFWDPRRRPGNLRRSPGDSQEAHPGDLPGRRRCGPLLSHLGRFWGLFSLFEGSLTTPSTESGWATHLREDSCCSYRRFLVEKHANR